MAMDAKLLDELLSGDDLPREKESGMMMRCNDGVDRISQLPDEVIVDMLSFLPFNTAAATSVLSHRWIDLWKYMPTLRFEDFRLQHGLYHLFDPIYYVTREQYEDGELRARKYVNWVNSVLESYKSRSLQEFVIAVLVEKLNQHEVTKWIEFAFSRGVKTLKLNSNEFWANAGVLAEILKGTSIPGSDFKSLKVLWLNQFKMSSEAIEFFLRNCPSLERLVLDKLIVTTDLEVGGLLKHLDMRSQMSMNSVKISTPNLTWLTIDHDPKKVSLEYVPKLVNMTFYCRSSFGGTMHDFAKVAAQLETLIIYLIQPKASFSVPEMPKLKKLVVYYTLQEKNVLLPVTCFIRASPALEEFKIEISELAVQREIFQIPKDGPSHAHEHRHLRSFVLSGFCGCACDRIELVRYVVDNCAALIEIVVGQCDREALVRDFVDYCVPLKHIILRPIFPHVDYVTTPQERRHVKKAVRQFTPDHIKQRVV